MSIWEEPILNIYLLPILNNYYGQLPGTLFILILQIILELQANE